MAILIEIAITPFFLFDFVYRLLTAPTRCGYVIRRYGWADLIAVVPFLRLVPAVPGLERDPRGAGRRHGAPGRRPLRQPCVGDLPADDPAR